MILELIWLLLHLTRIHKSLHVFIADVVVIFAYNTYIFKISLVFKIRYIFQISNLQ